MTEDGSGDGGLTACSHTVGCSQSNNRALQARQAGGPPEMRAVGVGVGVGGRELGRC